MGIIEAHNVRIVGKGEQAVVLSHCCGTDQSVWKYLVPHLVEDYRVILYDNMGSGTTNPDYFDFERYSSIEGFVYDLLAILDELKIESCIFVSHSFLSMVGVIASIARPDLFSKLVMLSPTPRLLNDKNYNGGFEQEQMNQMFEAMRSNYKAWCSGFAPMVVGGDLDSVDVQEFCRTLFNMRPDITLSLAYVKFSSDMRHLLPTVKVPCHILQGKMDNVVPVEVSEFLHQTLGGPSIVELMPTNGHLPQLSSPEVVIAAILKHLRLDITQ